MGRLEIQSQKWEDRALCKVFLPCHNVFLSTQCCRTLWMLREWSSANSVCHSGPESLSISPLRWSNSLRNLRNRDQSNHRQRKCTRDCRRYTSKQWESRRESCRYIEFLACHRLLPYRALGFRPGLLTSGVARRSSTRISMLAKSRRHLDVDQA